MPKPLWFAGRKWQSEDKALENLMIFNENGEGSTPLVRKAWRIIGVF
jgi:hypothetical protein